MLMKRKSKVSIALAMLCALSAQNVSAAGDASKGQKVYEDECAECHALKGANKKGPTLNGMFGRKAGSVPDFEYSKEMKASGITWTTEKLDSYLTMPRKFVPGALMKYDGLMDAKARADLIAFIQSLK